MSKEVKKGEKILASVKVEFEGTIRSHSIFIEKQFIPTTNGENKNAIIILNGDPIDVSGTFLAVKGSKIKNFEVTINNKTATICKDVTFKGEGIEINIPKPYKEFDLKETKERETLSAFNLALEKTLEENSNMTLIDALALFVNNTNQEAEKTQDKK